MTTKARAIYSKEDLEAAIQHVAPCAHREALYCAESSRLRRIRKEAEAAAEAAQEARQTTLAAMLGAANGPRQKYLKLALAAERAAAQEDRAYKAEQRAFRALMDHSQSGAG